MSYISKQVAELVSKAKYNDFSESEQFSSNYEIDYEHLFKKRIKILSFLMLTSLLLQAYCHIKINTLPRDALYATTFNGTVFRLPDPYPSLESAVEANKAIPVNLNIIFNEKDEDNG